VAEVLKMSVVPVLETRVSPYPSKHHHSDNTGFYLSNRSHIQDHHQPSSNNFNPNTTPTIQNVQQPQAQQLLFFSTVER